MSIAFRCNVCGVELEADDSMGGETGKCQKCGVVIKIPKSSAEAPPIQVTPTIKPLAGLPLMGTQPSVGASTTAASTTAASTTAASTTAAGVAFGTASSAPSGASAAAGDIPEAKLLPAVRTGGGELATQRDLALVINMVERGKCLDAIQALKSKEGTAAAEQPGYHYVRGLAFAGLGNYPQALDSLTRAIQGGIQTSQAYASKGRAELHLNRYAAAIESLDTALETAGTDVPDYMADLAKAYDGAKMPRDAVATWNALKQISPSHPALIERDKQKQDLASRKHGEQVQQAMLQMQKEQKSSDTACWICIILRILLECL